MRPYTITTCLKCGRRMKVVTRPHEHPLQKLLKQIAPTLCEKCRLQHKLPQRRM